MEAWQEHVCREAKTWEGTPYVPKARVKGVGADCGGFLYEVYNNPVVLGGATLPPFPQDYAADWALHDANGEKYLDFIMPFVKQVPCVRPGGFTLFHLGLRYAHAAIMLDDGYYIHAWGRLREGRVTKTAPRVMQHMATKQGKGFPAKHFEPK